MPDASPSSLPPPSQPGRRPIYLDNHATTRVDPQVVEEMLPFFDVKFGNAASVNHRFGWEAAEAVDKARERISEFVNAPAASILFTSGGTESNNLALKGLLRAAPRASHLIVNAAEHRSVLDPAKKLERQGFPLTILPVDEAGRLDPGTVAAALRPQTVLVSVMLANNEVGTINSMYEIAEICRNRGVALHCDAVQAVGRIPVDLAGLGADLVSFSAHKLYGPKGVGALYIHPEGRATRMEPLLDGGGHERRLRSGTLAVPLIVGFGAACRLASQNLIDEASRIAKLRDRLWHRMTNALKGLTLNGHASKRLPGNLNVSFDGVDGEALMNALTEIAVSSGSACTTSDPEPSHVLRAMGLAEPRIKASVRFGLGRFTTQAEVDFSADYVAQTVSRLRPPQRAAPPAGP